MIESTSSNSLYSANYLNINRSIISHTTKENDHKVQQQNFQMSHDQVNVSYTTETITTYNSSLSLETTMEDGYDMLRGLVLNIFKEQGLDYQVATDDSEIDISTISPEEAKELIADDGYFGVEKTSERIFNFAVGFAGGDSARIETIREGVENGFQEAMAAFGGWLPEISHETYDTVMKKLDDWAAIPISPEP